MNRTIGAEYVGNSTWEELNLTNILKELGFTEKEISISKLLVIGRLVNPASELKTVEWARNKSALDEIIGKDWSNLSKNVLYRISDKLYKNKDEIEKALSNQEKDLFNLRDNIFIYDLTNTYFEGMCLKNKKAQFGPSKEKRTDCRLVAFSLRIDEKGFIKESKIYKGNQPEAETLDKIIDELEEGYRETGEPKEKPTIIIDAGISTKKIIDKIKDKRYKYITVHRGKIPEEIDKNKPFEEIIREDEKKDIKIEVTKYELKDEILLYCRSNKKEKKDNAIKTRIEKIFKEKIENLIKRVKKGTIKIKNKIIETIGRIKEKYNKVSQYYEIEIKDGEIPKEISEEEYEKEVMKKCKTKKEKEILGKFYKKDKEKKNYILEKDLEDEEKKNLEKKMKELNIIKTEIKLEKNKQKEEKVSGTYLLKTNRTDLSNKEIWETYRTINKVEDAFRAIKGDLQLRPNFHQLSKRVEGHIFISILAYHLLHYIEVKLEKEGDHRSWGTIRDILESHTRITVSMRTKSGKGIHTRMCTTAEKNHNEIYRKLGLKNIPMPKKRYVYSL
jgi:hypothetical protein